MSHVHVRFVAALALVFGMFSGQASADNERAEKLEGLTKKLVAVEAQLSEDDRHSVEDHIAGLERILRRYQAAPAVPVRELACLSDGETGASERFNITDAATGTALEKSTTLANCKQLLTVQNQDLICVSNGETGASENFGVYDMGKKEVKGGFTTMKTCQTLVSRAHGPFVCSSNGETGASEKFHLYNRDADKTLGGDTQFAQCLASIPK